MHGPHMVFALTTSSLSLSLSLSLFLSRWLCDQKCKPKVMCFAISFRSPVLPYPEQSTSATHTHTHTRARACARAHKNLKHFRAWAKTKKNTKQYILLFSTVVLSHEISSPTLSLHDCFHNRCINKKHKYYSFGSSFLFHNRRWSSE